MSTNRPRAVVLGGGTGAPASIRALLNAGCATDAVVAMADDGGSSGLLRERCGMVPPGDIRKCLVAMAAEPDTAWTQAFRQRLAWLNDHTLGNLILATLTDVTDSFPQAIALCEQLLGARGHVYPSTLESVQLMGRTLDGRTLSGQAAICHSQTALDAVCLKPRSPQAYQPALEAIMAADVIVLGPGSLFTSIIPNLLVPGVLEAIRQSRALTCFVCSLTDMQGETWGLDAAELVEMLLAHGMDGLLDVVIAQQDSEGQRPQGNVTAAFAAITEQFPPSGQAQSGKTSTHRVTMDEAMARRVLAHGIQVVLRDLTDPLHPSSHDVSALSDVLKGVISRCPSRLK